MRWASEDVMTIRFCALPVLEAEEEEDGESRSGSRRLVKRKGPTWFVPNCSSMPSSVRERWLILMPTLLNRTSIPRPSLLSKSLISSAAFLMLFWLDKSTLTSLIRTSGWEEWMLWATSWSLPGVREARTRRRGEWAARAWARAAPMLLSEIPVMRT